MALARPHDLKMPNSQPLDQSRRRAPLMARQHASRIHVMALARPRSELSHIRPKLPSCMARSRPPLGVSAQPARPRDVLGASAPWHLVLSERLLEGLRAHALLMARPCKPINKRFWASNAWRARDGPQEEINGCKGEREARTPPTWKSPRLAGLPTSLPTTSPKFVLRLNKLLVLAIAADAVETHPKARGSIQAPIEEPPKDIKGKKTARISVKPLRKRFSQRIIALGGPYRPKPKKVEVIDLISDDEAEEKGKEAAMEQPILLQTKRNQKRKRKILSMRKKKKKKKTLKRA
ncbi:hypothetical protein PIB30_048229 [Stylosanthes scabra]|uniref:Mitochondrial mRNA-processing protein COX24 C-terminal domain-containing protein n=1 Tax=Stylosanthes scabra TaxID=79078 RepID=A0ABU6VHZ6_9FABA|nr:hypothetical protein [Stylosanthes scabra]